MNQKTKYYVIIAGVMIVLVVVSLFIRGKEEATNMVFYDGTNSNVAQVMQTEEVEEDVNVEPTMVYVYLCGAVVEEGVYEVPSGTRIFEVIALAGGLREDAAGESVNQASEVVDGQQIIIYTKEEFQEQIAIQEAASNGLVNINRASVEQLCQLTGIGESRASDIVAYREGNGSFTTIEDIMNVTGIKDAMFEKIKDYITVD
ncbi:MAG: helix-hairpin-helix domain-containing protein [Eubacteriales bacterium]